MFGGGNMIYGVILGFLVVEVWMVFDLFFGEIYVLVEMVFIEDSCFVCEMVN